MYDRGNDGFGFIRLGGDANGIRQCGRVMELLNSREEPTIEQTVESLAQTVAHLALQLTIAQLQLRALGAALESAGVIADADVAAASGQLAEMHAAEYLAANMGSAIAAMVDIPELERDVIAYLATR
jgi:hypothetical protein